MHAPVESSGGQALPTMDAVRATLASWHVEGAHRADPVRFALIEAMARRADRYEGAARQVLEARLTALLDGYRALLGARGIPPQPQAAAAPVPRGALGQMVDAWSGHVAPAPRPAVAPARVVTPPKAVGGGSGRAPSRTGARAPVLVMPDIDLETVALHSAAAPVVAHELQSVRRFRGTWSRLSAQDRLRQTLAQVPPQAGPLNSLHLLHRALVQMQDIAPDYLQHFVAHVDALLWLEQVHSAVATPTAARGRSAARSIAARNKSGSKTGGRAKG